MASDPSFDIVNDINFPELDNALMQAKKEMATRFDFRGTSAGIGDLDKKEKILAITADNEPQLEAVLQVLVSKMTKRGVDPRCLDRQKIEAATHSTLRQKIKLKSGIDRQTAKDLQKRIKDLGLKVNPSIQGDTLRVSAPKKDDLQAVMADLRAKPPEIPVQFTNYR